MERRRRVFRAVLDGDEDALLQLIAAPLLCALQLHWRLGSGVSSIQLAEGLPEANKAAAKIEEMAMQCKPYVTRCRLLGIKQPKLEVLQVLLSNSSEQISNMTHLSMAKSYLGNAGLSALQPVFAEFKCATLSFAK